MDCLHGVMMHNDEDQGGKHKAEDQYLRFKSVLDTEIPRAGPLDAEAQMHGVLMHGDSKVGEHHIENNKRHPENILQIEPKDLSRVIHDGMHDPEGTHVKHKWDNVQNVDDNVKSGPYGDRFMHGILMHGDENYEHVESKEGHAEIANDSTEKIGPKDAAQYLHGILMHGDAEPGKEHAHSESVDTLVVNKMGPNNDLHGILMHGDSGLGHDHSNDDANNEHDVFSDISQIRDLGLDDDLLKIIDLKKIMENDRQEYAEWIISNPIYQDDSMMGSTLASVSDTTLDDIELMKKRYLAKNNPAIGNDVDDNFQPFDEHPFTVEDAKSVYDVNLHAEEGEDMRHDLELLGSTEPLNARHKAKLALLKARYKK